MPKPTPAEKYEKLVTKEKREKAQKAAQEDVKRAMPEVLAELNLSKEDVAATPEQRESMLSGKKWRYTRAQGLFFNAMCERIHKKWGAPLYVIKLALKRGLEAYAVELSKEKRVGKKTDPSCYS